MEFCKKKRGRRIDRALDVRRLEEYEEDLLEHDMSMTKLHLLDKAEDAHDDWVSRENDYWWST